MNLRVSSLIPHKELILKEINSVLNSFFFSCLSCLVILLSNGKIGKQPHLQILKIIPGFSYGVLFFSPMKTVCMTKKMFYLTLPENGALVECSTRAGYCITCKGQFIST